MSKSLKRVRAALQDNGVETQVLEMQEATRTAAQAAQAVGCEIDQIAKSIIFARSGDDGLVLFVTAGGNQVDPSKASALAGGPLQRADAAQVRAITGFAIGGVSPIGHLNPSPVFIDPQLLEFDVVYAAAGTPRHVFAVEPQILKDISNAQASEFTS